MDSNNNQMKFLPKDDNGYIINDTDPSKISADFLPLISEVKNIIIDTLGSSLHSIYLTGSVPRGVAAMIITYVAGRVIIKMPKVK